MFANSVRLQSASFFVAIHAGKEYKKISTRLNLKIEVDIYTKTKVNTIEKGIKALSDFFSSDVS